MPFFSSARSADRRRRWTLAVAYMALLASCDSPFAPDVEEVVRLEVSPPVLLMVVGGSATLSAQVYGTGDNLLPTAKVFWSSQDPTVVTVNQEGVATAVASGTAQIAASAGGLSRTIALTVSQRPIALVRVAPPAGTVAVGATLALQGEALDGTGALLPNRVFDWVSSAPTVATVNASGLVTGVSVGQATISATGEGKTGSALVTVIPTAIATISVQPNGGSLPAGGTMQFVATPRDAGGQAQTGRTLEWRSSNDAIATVSSSGLLTAISPGSVTITVSAPGAGPGGSTPSTSVNVTVLIQPVANAVVVPSPASLQVGQTVALTVNLFDSAGNPLSATGRTITWSSSNVAVATVNASGTVSGVAVGSASITATITTPGQPGSIQASSDITVSNQPVASVLVTPNPATVHVGYSRQFTAVARNAAGQTLPGRAILWTSSNQSLASVNAGSGVVTGVSVGSVQIIATSEGVQGFSSVTVDLVAVTSVSVTPPTATVMPAQTVQLAAVPRDSAGTAIVGPALGGRPTVWASSNTAAATVSATGLVTGVAQGSSNATATIGGTIGQSLITVNPLPSAAQLSITTQPSGSPQNDVVFPVQPVIQLKDASGANVAQAGVTIQAAITAPGTGTLGGTLTAVTNAGGTATFSGLKITGTTGVRTLTFSSGALTPATSGAVNVQPGPATQLVITTQPPSTASSGQAFSSATVVQLRDVSGNNVPQSGVTVSASVLPSGGVTLGGGSTTTDASGAATFGALNLTGPAGTYTLTFASGALTPAVSSAIALSAGSGSKLSLSTQPSATAQSGVVFAQQPVVQLLDGSNNPVAQPGVVVSVAILTGGGSLGGTTTATTNASGMATFSGLSITGTVGARTLLFGATGYTTVASSAINLTAGPPAALTVAAQPSSNAQSGVAFASQPAVQLTDASGNPVSQAGVSVSVSLNGAGGSLIGSTSATTNASGLATFSGLGISGTAGTYSLAFASSGLTGATSASIALAAGAAAQLTITTQPAGAASGSPFTTQPAIQVRDAQGNPVSQAGITVTPSIASGGAATLLGGSATTNAAGLAQFSGLGLTGPLGDYTIGFAAPALTGVTSGTIALGPGAPALMTIVQQPAGATSGAAFATQPSIQLSDAQSNPVTVAGITVTASVTGGGATLVGSASATTNGSGVATFSNLGLSGPVGNYTLDFSSSGVPNVTSGTIALAAGPPAQLTIATQPSSTVGNGSVLAQQPAVQVRDAGGNPLTINGLTVSVSISAGGASLTGSTTANTTNGVATFSGLGITGPIGSYTLTFSAAGLTDAISSPISVTAGAPTQLSVTTQPGGATSGNAFATQPAIQLRDAGGNASAQAGVTITATIASGPGGATLLGSGTATTDGTGLATFSGLGLTGTVGSYTLTFASPPLTSVTSGAISLAPGAAAQVTIQTAPAGAASGAPFVTQPVILVRDAQGNPVLAGVTVTASVTGASIVGSPTALTNSSGVATFSGLGLSGLAGSYTVDFTVAGAPSASASVGLGAGAAAKLVMSTQPSSSVASGSALAQAPAVQLQDASGNNVGTNGVQVTVSMSPAGASLTGSTTAVTSSGIASFTGLGIMGTVGSYTLSFSSSGLTGATSGSVSVTAGPRTQVAITTQPPSAVLVGAPFSAAPVVQLRDASGNPVSDANVDITATLGGTGGGTLGGTTTVQTNGSGTATFGGLSIDAAGTYTITFSSSGLTSATSSSISVTAPTQLSITTQPSASAASGAAFGTQPAIQLRDGNGIAVPASGVQVTASIASGTGTLIGTTTATTDGSGLATFSGLGISGTAGNFTLSFTSGSLTSATSGTIAVGPGAPTQVQITTQPGTTTAINGQALSPQPVVKLLDAAGNNATSNGVQVTASLNGAGGSITAGSTASTTNGVATFSGLTITGLVGNYTITFTASGVAGTATSGTVTLTAGAAANVTMQTQPGGAAINAALSPAPVVLVTDVSGNPVSGVSVTAAKETGSGSLSGTTNATTNTSGLAPFSNLTFNQTGIKTLRFSITGASVVSASFNIS
ncbi:MAG TPA: Ig-like domain-containing protein [Gemmatimonadaceae bacterium]